MCLEVADEANPGKKASPTGRERLVDAVPLVLVALALCASCFYLAWRDLHSLLYNVGSFDNGIAPGGSVRGEKLSRLSAFRETFRLSLNFLCPPTVPLP